MSMIEVQAESAHESFPRTRDFLARKSLSFVSPGIRVSRKRLVRGFAAGLVLCLPAIAFAAGTPRTFSDLANLLLTIIGQATLVLMVAAIAAYFFNIAYNMIQLSKGETAEWKSHVLWGIIAIFVMVSIWGIVQILQYTIFTPGGGTASGGGRSGNCTSFANCGN